MRTDIENWESMALIREKINALWKAWWRKYELTWDADADLLVAKEIYEDKINWWNPVIKYNWNEYIYWYESWWIIRFVTLSPSTTNYNTWYSYTYEALIRLTVSGWTVTAVDFSYNIWTSPRVLATNVNYSTPYTPAYPWSPATKKYVDDKVPNDGTTWQVLTKTETWSEWQDASSWGNIIVLPIEWYNVASGSATFNSGNTRVWDFTITTPGRYKVFWSIRSNYSWYTAEIYFYNNGNRVALFQTQNTSWQDFYWEFDFEAWDWYVAWYPGRWWYSNVTCNFWISWVAVLAP